jgi:hypothetical protein
MFDLFLYPDSYMKGAYGLLIVFALIVGWHYLAGHFHNEKDK